MSHTTADAAELCAVLVDEHYGELASRIFTLLLRRGRQTVPTLAQYTRLPSRHLRHGLSVLIQQNLVYFFYDRATRTTHYEANPDAAYMLLRSGKILDMVRSQLGNTAAEVMQCLLYLGHSTVEDVVKTYRSRHQPQENGAAEDGTEHLTNGHTDGIKTTDQLHTVIVRLLEAGYVHPIVPRMLQSPADVREELEKQILRERYDGSVKGPKQVVELRRAVVEKLLEQRSEGEEWQQRGAKRTVNGDHYDGGEKRRKLQNGAGVNGDHTAESAIDPSLIIRVNYEKCTVSLRNQMLVNLAAHDISHTTSQAYSELLKLVERKIPRCRTDLGVEFPEEAEDEEDDSTEADPQHIVGTTDVLKVLPSHVKLSTGLVIQDDDDDDGDEAVTSPQRKRKRKPNDVGGPNGRDDHDDSDVDEHGNIREVERDSDDEIWDRDFDPGASKKSPQKQRKVAFVDDHASREDFHNRLIELKRHLGVLAVHSRKFVTQEGGHGSGEWSVPFRKLIKSLKEAELDKIIYQMFGRLGLRISQILRQKGKLEERGIQGMGLMKIKDVKSKLIEMQLAGFVDVQEIPKGNNRAFQQMIYLWYFDTPRVEQLVLDKIYKAMTRSLQALQAEKGNYLEVLAMAERTDVRGNEEELLSEVALRDLRKIRAFEEKTYVQINRLDELVGVFRDF